MGAILVDTATELNKPLLQPQKQYAKEGLSGWLTRLCDLANSVKNIMPQLMLKESLIQQEVPLSCPSWFEETVCYMLSRLARLFINKAIAANTALFKAVTHRQECTRPQWNPRSYPAREDVNGVPWASIPRQLPQGWLLTLIPRLLALGDHFNFNTVPKLWRLNSHPRQQQLHLDTLSSQAWFFPCPS